MGTLLSTQLFFAALVTGALYALVALGLNLVYGTMRLLNVAHGEILMVGSYVSFWAFQLFGVGPLISGIAATALAAAAGAAVYFGLLRRTMSSAKLAARLEGNSLLLFFGVSVILQNLAALLFTATPRAYPYLGEVLHLGNASLVGRNLAALAAAALACGGAILFLRGSRTGMALRALIQHREASAVVGIDVGRVQLISLCLGFGAAGLAGALVSMLEPTSPFMGGPFTMASFVVIILGGLGNLTGGVAAGLLLGAVETYGVALTSPTYRSILIYGVFLGVLLLRPQGLFGLRKDRPMTVGRAAGFAAGIALLSGLALAPRVLGDYLVGVGLSLLMWVALTQSWAVFSGMSGYISLGHCVFYGIGAYVMVLTWGHVRPWVGGLLAGVASGLFALLAGYPVLRVRGPYFVILTYGLAELVKFMVVNLEAALGKSSRLLFGAPGLEDLYYVMLGLAAAATALTAAVRGSRFGSGLRAIREDEEAAETLGVPAASVKSLAFTLSAVVPGMVGAVMAMRLTYFQPLQVFSPALSFTIVTMAIIGGSDRVPGPLLGVLFLGLASELLWASAPEVYMILLGILLIAFVLLAPDGIYGQILGWRAGRRAQPCTSKS